MCSTEDRGRGGCPAEPARAQHPRGSTLPDRDALDEVNQYIVATRNGEVIGCVSVTPPGKNRYSIDPLCLRPRTLLVGIISRLLDEYSVF